MDSEQQLVQVELSVATLVTHHHHHHHHYHRNKIIKQNIVPKTEVHDKKAMKMQRFSIRFCSAICG